MASSFATAIPEYLENRLVISMIAIHHRYRRMWKVDIFTMSTNLFTAVIISGVLAPGSTSAQDSPLAANNAITLSGELRDESGLELADAAIIVNGVKFAPDSNGLFQAKAEEEAIYDIRFESDQHYSMIHTFSHEEVMESGGRLPAVTLVQKKPGRVMLAFGGDAMMGRRFKKPFPGEPQRIRPGHELEDSKALLRHIKPYTELSDYTSVNLECPLMDRDPREKAKKSYTFFSHSATAPALAWAGVDYVCLGNNHIIDYLDPGIESTLSVLDSSPLAYSGAGLTESQALAAHRETIGGVDYSLLGFVSWKGNSTPNQVAVGDEKSGAAYGTQEKIVSAVETEAAQQNTVVVQYHGGYEYSYGPSDRTVRRLRAAIDHGADLVVGHHPHVLQGFEVYNGKLIAYSLGNFLFDQYRYETQRSAILYVWMDDETFHAAEIVPIHIQNYHVTPGTGNIREYVLKRVICQSLGRGLQLGVSGGHGFIHATTGTAMVRSEIALTRKDQIGTVSRMPLNWHQIPTGVAVDGKPGTLQFGEDMLLVGGFEQHELYQLPESTWEFTHEASGVVSSHSHNGRQSLRLAAAENARMSLARQKYFFRFNDFSPDCSMSLVGYAKASGPATLNLSLELWPDGWGRTRARSKLQTKHVGTLELAKGSWQPFHFDVDPLDPKLKGCKICLGNSADESSQQPAIFVDDLSLVAWSDQTTTSLRDSTTGRLGHADYIRPGVQDEPSGTITLKFLDYRPKPIGSRLSRFTEDCAVIEPSCHGSASEIRASVGRPRFISSARVKKRDKGS